MGIEDTPARHPSADAWNAGLREEGTRLFCLQCGMELPSDARFCGRCGKAVPEHAVTSSPAANGKPVATATGESSGIAVFPYSAPGPGTSPPTNVPNVIALDNARSDRQEDSGDTGRVQPLTVRAPAAGPARKRLSLPWGLAGVLILLLAVVGAYSYALVSRGNGEIEALKGQVSQLEAANIALGDERTQLLGDRETLTKERDGLAVERKDLFASRDSLAADRDRLTAERDRLSTRVGDLDKQAGDLKASAANSDRQASQAREEAARQQARASTAESRGATLVSLANLDNSIFKEYDYLVGQIGAMLKAQQAYNGSAYTTAYNNAMASSARLDGFFKQRVSLVASLQ